MKGWENKSSNFWSKMTPEKVQECLDNGDKIDARNMYGLMPLHLYLNMYEDKNPDVVRALLDAGADAEAKITNTGNRPIHEAGQWCKNLEVIKILLVDYKVDVNSPNKYGVDPLWLAASTNRNPKVMLALVIAGAEMNPDRSKRSIPFHEAAKSNQNPEVALAFLELGADVKEKDAMGNTPFDYAQRNEKFKGTKALEILGKASGQIN